MKNQLITTDLKMRATPAKVHAYLDHEKECLWLTDYRFLSPPSTLPSLGYSDACVKVPLYSLSS